MVCIQCSADRPNDTPDGCEITLYDGDNFTDDKVTVKGPAEFANLNKLPGSDKIGMMKPILSVQEEMRP